MALPGALYAPRGLCCKTESSLEAFYIFLIFVLSEGLLTASSFSCTLQRSKGRRVARHSRQQPISMSIYLFCSAYKHKTRSCVSWQIRRSPDM
jgi:hypothetical protein